MFTEKEVKITLLTQRQHAHGQNSYVEYVVFYTTYMFLVCSFVVARVLPLIPFR